MDDFADLLITFSEDYPDAFIRGIDDRDDVGPIWSNYGGWVG